MYWRGTYFREKLGMVFYQYYISTTTGFIPDESEIIIKDPRNLRIRIEDEKWCLQFFFDHLIISESFNVFGEEGWNESEQFRIFKSRIAPNANENKLIDFLKFLEEKYKKAGIIKKSKILLNDGKINKIKNWMKNLGENHKGVQL